MRLVSDRLMCHERANRSGSFGGMRMQLPPKAGKVAGVRHGVRTACFTTWGHAKESAFYKFSVVNCGHARHVLRSPLAIDKHTRLIWNAVHRRYSSEIIVVGLVIVYT